MMEFKGTQGPWTDEDGIIRDPDGTAVAYIQQHANVNTIERTGQFYSHADANLIVASKALLEALQNIVRVGCEYYDMECGENGGPAIEQAEAAIAKALGDG